MNWLIGDLKYALRGMARRPGFTLIAVFSLALGIGANTTIFTLLNGILLRSIAVENPSTLAVVYGTDARSPGALFVSYPNYKDLRDHNSVFAHLSSYVAIPVSLNGMGDPRHLMAHLVSGDYFQTLGVHPVLGRGFLPEEDVTLGAYPVAVISYGLWNRLFASDPHVTSRTLTISGRPFRIVGVAPESFGGVNELYAADLWIPMAMYPQVFPAPALVNNRRSSQFSVVGRLKPGVTMAQAQGSMQSLAAELAKQYPRENAGRSITLAPIAEATLSPKDREDYSRTGSILLVISGIVLLIACANVANLLLARAAGREKEITVRIAVGASRWDLMRQLLVESVTLSIAGGAVGLLVAQCARSLLWPMRPPALKYAAFHFDLDLSVLAYTFGIALLTGVVFGLFPAFGSSRVDLASSLKERSGASQAYGGRWPPRAILVMLQIAFSLVALLGAALFLRSMQAGMRIDPGFDVARLGVISFNLTDQGYDSGRGREYYRRLFERIPMVPYVESLALGKDSPFAVSGSRVVLLAGQENVAGAGRSTLTTVTSPGYFQTMRIPLIQGRDFAASDVAGGPRVALVNEVAAKYFWPGQDPIGKVIQFSGEFLPVEIVGIARPASYVTPGEAPRAMVYLSTQQYYFPYGNVYIRTTHDVPSVLREVEREMRAIDPNLYLDSETVETSMRRTLWRQSLSAALLSAFGGIALLLSSIGIYGVMSYSVSLRVREIGVRMALGADPSAVRGMLLREGARLVGVGVFVGLAAAFASSRILQNLLVGVGTRDLTAFVVTPCVLAVVAMAACWIPTRRATRIDPAVALRSE
jgi:predicted permease